jgi:hypothetical protein
MTTLDTFGGAVQRKGPVAAGLSEEGARMIRQSVTVAFSMRCLAALWLVMATSTASTAANTYVVDRVVGSGRVTGTIVTNGRAGILAASDIVDWNLSLETDGDLTTVGQLRGPVSGANSIVTHLEGDGLTATETGLFFDFADDTVFQITDPLGCCSATWLLSGAPNNWEIAQESPYAQSFAPQEPTTQQIAVGLGSSYQIGLSLARVRVRDEAEDGFRFRVNFTIDLCGDDIDPAAEPVGLVVSTPLGTVYPVAPDVFPIAPGEFELVPDPAGRRWQLTAAARQRTGIERFDIDDRDGSIVFVDRHISLPTQSFEHLGVELTIGNDTGRAKATLVEQPCGSGLWRVGR